MPKRMAGLQAPPLVSQARRAQVTGPVRQTTAHCMSPTRLSLPKDKIRILLLEGISDSAVDCLAEAGYATVKRERELAAMTAKGLCGRFLRSRRRNIASELPASQAR